MPKLPHSKRLVFRPIAAEDETWLHAHWNRPEVRRYLWDDQEVAPATVRAIVWASEADFSRAGYGLWSLARATDGAFIGMCGLRRVGDGPEVELLYSLEPEAQGAGLATEAAAAVMAFALNVLRLPRVLAGVDAPNTASMKLLERLGMRPVDDVRGEGEVVYWGRSR